MLYITTAMLSALLFGASTPLGKYLLDSLPPFRLAGLLYLGAALGTLPFTFGKRNLIAVRSMGNTNRLRLSGAIGFGGIIGPVLLLFGLRMASSASVAMWLNLELAATAILGYFIFRDHLGVRGWIGVSGTLIASVILSWQEGSPGVSALLLVGGASLCWGLDNHLTALIDGITPLQSTFWKGLVAGSTNLVISSFVEPSGPVIKPVLYALIVGVFAYGFSISLYILSAQNLGATRSQMIFASAPFFGVILSVLILGETVSRFQFMALSILIVSLTILFRDRHTHFHTHESSSHKHMHGHDNESHHHNHDHRKTETALHDHWHAHSPQSHSHPHWPDIHHRHKH